MTINIKKDFGKIEAHYKKLIEIANRHYFIGIVNEWIVDNFYLLVEQKDQIRSFFKHSKYVKYTTKNVDLYEILGTILERYNYKLTLPVFLDELKKYQEEHDHYFYYEELSIMHSILSMLLLQKVAEICSFESSKMNETEHIDELIEQMKFDHSSGKEIKLENYITITKETKDYLIVYLNEQLKELGPIAPKVFKQLNVLLEDKNRSLRNSINQEHLDGADLNILISNIFTSIHNLDELKEEELYDQVSNVEAALKKDKYYDKMTEITKRLYRKQVIRRAHQKKQPPVDFVKDLLKKGDHIGNYLFKNQTQNKKFAVYLFTIAILTIVISAVCAIQLFPVPVLSFLLLLIPVSEVLFFLTNRIILRLHRPVPLMKMDYSKGLPSDCGTMVVIPTIIKDKKKVNQVFESLEKYYLANKTNHLYFTLLADCKEHDQQKYEKDAEIIQAGKVKVEELNKKYGKTIFYFVYRNRFWNSCEESYLGYERKRGALLQFNDLLLGKMSAEEREKWFQVDTFDHFQHKIRYVITLDVDTQLILNSVTSLVGTMNHPLNRPVLNEEKTKVVAGYGILQPTVNIDIDSTNKSMFSQVYAGIGGFDSYSNTVPNFYQDVFKEGSFQGKGIYDLEVCQEILKPAFPDHLILSHDLLEGNYLRCGCVSDITLIDDFPSKYISDATRRARWARGDIQIIDWITPKVRNAKNEKVKNPLGLLEKWKIFDNVRRGLLDLMQLILVVIAVFSYSMSLTIFCLGLVATITLLPILAYIIEQIHFRSEESVSVKYYNMLTFGLKAICVRTLSVLTSIPFNAELYVMSFGRSIYRMMISKKHLLNWITSEEAEKVADGSLKNLVKKFWLNFVVGMILLVTAIATQHHITIALVVAVLFFFGPLVAFLISQENKPAPDFVTSTEKQELLDYAKRTWKFFEENMLPENHYLIPDNYQLNRDEKRDHKTSPTNIGMSLLSIVSAYELGLISYKKAEDDIAHILDTIERLPKWNGHLYNWYRIDTLEVMRPSFISTIDSGNLVASLMVIKSFLLKNHNEVLSEKVRKMIQKANFKVFYTKNDVMSIGYNADEERLEPFNYNKFASESRITSYIAITKGDVPPRHWFSLDKTLTTYQNRKGLVSWSGTSFEYYMSLLFMKTYPNTLIDEGYDFAFYAQKHYMKEIDSSLPWGISESAYNELDNAQNYKYKAFATPYLRLREEPAGRIVIAPYASILALPKFPKEVTTNIKKYHKLNMVGEYGFLESYDVTDHTPVLAYYAHHQGMILTSLANYLKDNPIQEYFQMDIHNQAFEILTKEKVQIKPMINMKIMEYKKYTYEKEPFVNDIRVFNHLSSLPEVSVLSNAKYTVLVNDRGNGFSRYRTIQLNRYRKVTEQDYGTFLYIKDLATNHIWSNTYAPINTMPEKYEIVFALDRIKFIRQDSLVTTTTEIVVAKNHNAEIRKITFKNMSEVAKTLELTSYMEAILSENLDDISHRAFNNMFVDSEYDKETHSLIMHRKLRGKTTNYYMIQRLWVKDPLSSYEYETNRASFLGRNRTAKDPIALNKKLTNTVGVSIDPIASLRNRIHLDPGEEQTVYFISGFGKSKEQVLDIVHFYDSENVIEERAFEVATIMTNVNNKMVDITGKDMRLYNTMLNYLYQTSKFNINEERKQLLVKNGLNQENLWKFGISGDYPIILVDIDEVTDLSVVKEFLHAFEYYKSKSIFIDLVFLNTKEKEMASLVAKEIDEEKYHMNAINSFYKIPGNIFIIDRYDTTEEERILLSMVARLSMNTKEYLTLESFVEELQKKNKVSIKERIKEQDSLPCPYNPKSLRFFNGYGGFSDRGREYTIVTKDTPLSWSNILTNGHFGSIITNNHTGYTFGQNSREFKITSWTNDALVDDKSEGMKWNDTTINFDLVKHGFGYTTFLGKYRNFDLEVTEFVTVEDSVKVYRIKVKNNGANKERLSFKYWINPTLGAFEEKTSRYLLCDYQKEKNYVTLNNRYSKYFHDQVVFMTSTLPIESVRLDRILIKEIETSVVIPGKEETEFAVLLGVSKEKDVSEVISKYQSYSTVEKEWRKMRNNWKEDLEKIQVKTPSESFDYMMNGWYLYQTLASRLYARAGFYQVSGAFGFRDQLQDSMNVVTVRPDLTRKQILINARHQFREGDVLHWWHDDTDCGLRSKYKDDYLWLIYAIAEYIETTGDKKILTERVPFVEGPLLNDEEERLIPLIYSTDSASIYEHCRLAIAKSMQELGENGLPLMGGGDWNDGMNRIGSGGKGTSVWLGFFLYLMIEKFEKISKWYDAKSDVAEYSNFREKLASSLQENAWDGEYFLRAFFDNGHKLGSKENKECKIDLISQSYAILTGIATKDQTSTILRNVDDQLVDKNLNIVKLISPAFKENEDNPGYIMDYPKGIRENGGQYTHGVSWYITALLKLGYNDDAYRIYQMINPIERTKDRISVDRYQVEPYVLAGDIYSSEFYPGRGGWTWYTGSAGWFYKIGLVDILGFQKNGTRLSMKPNLPKDWDQFEITYHYGKATYCIAVKRSKGKKLTIDGEVQKNNWISLSEEEHEYEVIWEIGDD